MSKEVDEKLREAAKRNFDLISKSESFCVLFNEKMVEEVIPLIQMGLAIYLDKPIIILAPKGATIPMNIRRLALAIEEYDRDPEKVEESLKTATTRLFERINQ